MMTDPIADMLTRMRNALMSGASHCVVPGSRLKVAILDANKREGFINTYEVASEGPRSAIRVEFRFGPDGERVISSLARFSRFLAVWRDRRGALANARGRFDGIAEGCGALFRLGGNTARGPLQAVQQAAR
jgi:ribosomal protein S8